MNQMLLNVIDVIKIQEVAVLETSEPQRSHLLGPAYCLVLLIVNRILASFSTVHTTSEKDMNTALLFPGQFRTCLRCFCLFPTF